MLIKNYVSTKSRNTLKFANKILCPLGIVLPFKGMFIGPTCVVFLLREKRSLVRGP